MAVFNTTFCVYKRFTKKATILAKNFAATSYLVMIDQFHMTNHAKECINTEKATLLRT